MTIIGQRSLCRADGSIHVVASHFIGDSASQQKKGGPSLPEDLQAVFALIVPGRRANQMRYLYSEESQC
jgi:hypothetical protein